MSKGFNHYEANAYEVYRKGSAGMEVSITTDAAGSGTYAGIITRVNQAATPGLQIALFEVEVSVTSANTSLRIGMNAWVTIKLE